MLKKSKHFKIALITAGLFFCLYAVRFSADVKLKKSCEIGLAFLNETVSIESSKACSYSFIRSGGTKESVIRSISYIQKNETCKNSYKKALYSCSFTEKHLIPFIPHHGSFKFIEDKEVRRKVRKITSYIKTPFYILATWFPINATLLEIEKHNTKMTHGKNFDMVEKQILQHQKSHNWLYLFAPEPVEGQTNIIRIKPRT